MRKLYCFDFDGTLTYKDTMFMFLRHYNSRRFYVKFALHIPLFALLKLRLMDAERVKKSFIASVLKGERRSRIEEESERFFNENFPAVMRQNALDFLNSRNPEQTESWLVTASLDIWVRPFAQKFGMKLLATEAEFRDDIFTGRFITPNCNGNEKLIRIREEMKGRKFDKIIAFGDTAGDKPMLNWADESYFRFFH